MLPPARLLEWDRRWLLECARAPAPPWVDRMLRLVTHAGGVTWTLVLPALLLVFAGSRHFALQILVANISSHLVVQALKRTIARPRPSNAIPCFDAMVHLPDQFSFPSGHACAATAVALSFLLTAHPAGLPLTLIAGLVGVSRVYLGVHYPSDVIVGHLLGAAGAISANLLI